jgi:hypothetical protein
MRLRNQAKVSIWGIFGREMLLGSVCVKEIADLDLV